MPVVAVWVAVAMPFDAVWVPFPFVFPGMDSEPPLPVTVCISTSVVVVSVVFCLNSTTAWVVLAVGFPPL